MLATEPSAELMAAINRAIADGVAKELAARGASIPRDPTVAAGMIFADEIRSLLGDEVPDDATVRRAAALAVADRAWTQHLGDLLETKEVVRLLGVSKQRVSVLVREHRVLALSQEGRFRFPAWQFALSAAQDRECLAVAHEALVRTGSISPWTAASWFQGAHPELDGVDPVTYLRNGGDRARLLRVAERDAARFAQ